MSNLSYIERLQSAILHTHACRAAYRGSVPVNLVFHGADGWKGDVEVFDLVCHPKADRCYAWAFGEPEQVITILELPPVNSAVDAVKMGVAQEIGVAQK